MKKESEGAYFSVFKKKESRGGVLLLLFSRKRNLRVSALPIYKEVYLYFNRYWQSAATARARWLMRFFASTPSSAKVSPSVPGMKTGS